MNILCFIDSLGSGGAQRQLTTLAVGLKKRGHEVRFLIYHPDDHFLWVLDEAGIPCEIIPPCSYWRRVLAVRRILGQGWQEVVLAFLEAPCLYAELARATGQSWALVAGERLADPRMKRGWARWLRQFHRCADGVIANSHTNRLMLEYQHPFLRGRSATVYNCVDLQRFRYCPADTTMAGGSRRNVFRIVVAASYQEKKNLAGVARAMAQIRKGPTSRGIVLEWYGDMPRDTTAYQQAARFIAEEGLTGCLTLHPATKAIEREFADASAVGLFSFFEGLPNAICEGMACGKPVILGDVCDAGSLVRDGRNGFLCDPHSPTSIADAIKRLAAVKEEDLQQMGWESRRMAEGLFAEEVVTDCYERILKAAVLRRPVPNDCNWPVEVPGSALRTVEQWVNGNWGT